MGRTGNDDTKIFWTIVPLKYLSNFWRTVEMQLISCEISLILIWSDRCFVIDNSIDNQEPIFTITDTKLYVPVVTLSIQDNLKLLEQLKSDFKRTNNWNKYEPKVTVEQRNQYLHFLIYRSFQRANRLFVLSFEDTNRRTSYKRYYLPLVEIKYDNIVSDRQNVFDQSIKNNLITSDNIQKIPIGQGNDYMNGCLLDYNYFDNYCKMIVIDLSEKQAFDADPKAMQQIYFTANLDRAWNKTVFSIIEEAKETILDFSQGTVKVLWMSLNNFILF